MTTTYSKSSPYYGTPKWGPFLDLWRGKTITPQVTDALYQIDSVYNLRPDLLAHDIYGDSNLWWVFSVRNPDVLVNPLLNFRTGVVIYVTAKATLQTALGI